MPHFTPRPHSLVIAAGISAFAFEAKGLQPEDVLVFSRDPILLRPRVAVSETYNDNIFYRSGRRTDDFITTLSPGLNFQAGRDEANFFSLDYQFSQSFYARNSPLNASEHHIGLANRLEWTRLRIEGRDRIQFLSSLVGGGEVFREEEGERFFSDRNIDRIVFFDQYTVSYALTPKTSIYGRGHYNAVDYEQGILLYDLNTLIGTLGFGFQAFPNTGFFGEIYYGQTATTPNFDAPKPPHSRFVGGFAGVRGNFTEKLSGTAKAGFESREFSDGTPTPSAPVMEVALRHQTTPKTDISLSYSRRTGVSVQFARESYVVDAVNLELKQRIGPAEKLMGRFGGTYQLYNYERIGGGFRREDQLFRAYLDLTYNIEEWLRATLGYSFETFNREAVAHADLDYHVNRVTLALIVGY
jgi:hypothetical protein